MSEKYLGEHSTPILINQIKEKCTLKVSTLPTASADELGKIYQYIGTTSGSIVHNYFYECVSDGEVTPTYSWQQVNVQPSSGTAATTSFDNTTSELQATNVQDAIDEVDATVDELETNKQDVIQVTTLPTASATELGKVYQYLGADDAINNLTHGYFYECTYDGLTASYGWEQRNVQPHVNPTASNISYDNTTSGLTADDVQEAIDEVEGRVDTAESDINTIEEKIPSTASDINQLVDHDSLGTAAFKDSTDRVSPNNTALVESQSVYSAINTALSSIYTPRGDITCAELTSSLLIAANVGNIYEVSDSGTTTALFLQGAGVPITTGSNVGIINAGQDRILFNLMANAFDLTDYQKKDLTTPITVDGVQKTTVEDALGGLNTAVSGRLQEIGALPTASADNLHKTYLLIGTQTGYDKGAIYQCQSDGEPTPTYSWVKISSADVPIATTSVAGVVKPDGESIDVDANGTISVDDNYKTMFVGTTAQWNNLTTAEKAKFDTYCLTDDIASGQMIVENVVQEGNHNVVDSDGVFKYVKHKSLLGRTSTASEVVGSSWDIIEFSDNFALCIGINTEAFTLNSMTAKSMVLPEGYTCRYVISANAFATGNTAWVTNTSHAYTVSGTTIGITTYMNTGTYGSASLRQIAIAQKG